MRALRFSELSVALLIVVISLLLLPLNSCQRAVLPRQPPGASDAEPTDSDREPPILAIAGAGATESAGSLRIEVTLSRASLNTVTVRYATETGSAEEGADYAAT